MTTSQSDDGPLGSMEIEVFSRGQTSSELRSWAAGVVAATFRRFNNHIHKIVVRIRDVNGGQEGVDKEATIALEIRGGGNKVIRHRGSNYRQAITGGLRRAKQVVQRSQRVGAKRPDRGRRRHQLLAT